MMNKKNVLLLLFILSGHFIYAQDIEGNSITEQIWLDYNPTFSKSEKVDVYADFGVRTIYPNEWYRFVFRPSFSYKLPKRFLPNLAHNSKLHGGVGFFFTNNLSEPNRFEIRPFQGIKLTWPNRPRINIRHYVRLEERFDIETESWSNTFGLRFRYQAEMVLFLKGDWLSFNDGVYLPIGLELFWNLIGVQQFNDAVRITPGVGYKFSDTWKGELGIGYFYTRNTVEDVFATNDLVLRIRLFHNLSSK
jgi:hypothetical protein